MNLQLVFFVITSFYVFQMPVWWKKYFKACLLEFGGGACTKVVAPGITTPLHAPAHRLLTIQAHTFEHRH